MDIKLIASFITSMTVIITCIWKMYSIAKRVEDKLDSYDKNIEQLNLHLNKMALLDPNLPIMDRMHAGEWYLAHGGNGFGKKVYNQLLKDLDTTAWGNKVWADSQNQSNNGTSE